LFGQVLCRSVKRCEEGDWLLGGPGFLKQLLIDRHVSDLCDSPSLSVLFLASVCK